MNLDGKKAREDIVLQFFSLLSNGRVNFLFRFWVIKKTKKKPWKKNLLSDFGFNEDGSATLFPSSMPRGCNHMKEKLVLAAEKPAKGLLADCESIFGEKKSKGPGLIRECLIAGTVCMLYRYFLSSWWKENSFFC
jgi:hypothetical protein